MSAKRELRSHVLRALCEQGCPRSVQTVRQSRINSAASANSEVISPDTLLRFAIKPRQHHLKIACLDRANRHIKTQGLVLAALQSTCGENRHAGYGRNIHLIRLRERFIQ